MIVDVSHINVKGFMDVYNVCEKPFIATHSNSYSICPHPRNLNDDHLRIIGETGSKVGVNIYPPFVDGEKGSIDMMLRHIERIMNICGEYSVGIGCDFDGIEVCPENIKDISDISRLYERVKEVWGEKTTYNIFYGNMYDFFSGKI